MKLLTNEQQSFIKAQTYATFVKKNATYTKYCNIRDQCHYTGECGGAAHSLCKLKYILLKEIPVVFHNSYKYDYHFIIKELAEEFEKQCKCL